MTPPPPPAGTATRRINNAGAGFAVLLVSLAALPNASVAPEFWLLWSALAGTGLAAHALMMARVAPGRALAIRRLWPILALGLAVPLWACVQILIALYGAGGMLAGQPVPSGSLAPGASGAGLARLLGYGAVFVLVVEVATRPVRARAMAWGLFAAVVLNAVWAIVALRLLGDISFWGEKTAYLGAATGTFVNRNAFATYLGMGLVLGMALVWEHHLARGGDGSRRPRWRVEAFVDLLAGGLALLAIATALVATQSRMGVAATLCAVFTLAIILAAKAGVRPGRIALLGTGGLLGAVALILGPWGKALFDRSLLAVGDAGSRWALHTQVVELIRARPLQGVGLDAFPVAFELVHGPGVASGVTWNKAHSTYLALWSELGVIAGSLPLAALAIAAYRLGRRVRRWQTGVAMPAAALGVMLLCALHATVDFSLEVPANMMLFLAILALGLAPRVRQAKDGGRFEQVSPRQL